MGIQIAGATVVDDSGQGVFANASISNYSYDNITSPLQGTVAGFAAGGADWYTREPPSATFPGLVASIEAFSFSNEDVVSEVGNLTAEQTNLAGASSETHGYAMAGDSPSGYPVYPFRGTLIEKFSFSNYAPSFRNSTLSITIGNAVGASSSNSGYVLGNNTAGSPPITSDIQKFAFSNDLINSDVGNLFPAYESSNSSKTHGYAFDGTTALGKFSFSNESIASSSPTSALNRNGTTGISSELAGYIAGGRGSPEPWSNAQKRLEKFPFATDTVSSLGSLLDTARGAYGSGLSSQIYGYFVTGYGEPTFTNSPAPIGAGNVERFSFASESTSINVTSLGDARYSASTHMD
jgi:hypothetical protein